MGEPQDATVPPPQLTIRAEDSVVVVAWAGPLDRGGATLLRDAVLAAYEHRGAGQRVEIDLTAVDGFAGDAVSLLTECSQLGVGVIGTIRFRVGAA